MPESLMKLSMTASFLGKLVLSKIGPKTGFFEFKEKFGHSFSPNLFYNEIFYYLLCSCTNPLFGKDLISEIYAKILSVSQIAEFLNELFLQSKSMKQRHF